MDIGMDYWPRKGTECIKAKKMNEALDCLSVFKAVGYAIFELGVKEWDRDSLDGAPAMESKSWFVDTVGWFESAQSWFDDKGWWICVFEKEFRENRRSDEVRDLFAECLYYWGYALATLARIAVAKEDSQEATALFGKAIKKYEETIEMGWSRQAKARGSLVASYFRLRLLTGSTENDKALIDHFKETNSWILGVLVTLDVDINGRLAESKLLNSIVDDVGTYDGRFFRLATEGADQKKIDAYKDVYIRSIHIISRLYIDERYEYDIASYRDMAAAQAMLFDRTKFRLSAIDYSNDPGEGQVLMDFLFDHAADRDQSQKIYGVFAGCFTFNCDSLNMFRLYGKGNEKEEATGVSMVFKPSFFSENVTQSVDPEDAESSGGRKHTLYRCIYFDAENGYVEDVGQRDKGLFKKEEGEEENFEYKIYKKKIDSVVKDVNKNLYVLRDTVQNYKLDHEVVGRLLINLRYLIKHSSFKEEQECRMLKLCHLVDEAGKMNATKDYKLYVDYDPVVSDHVEKIYFGPKAVGMARFQDFLKYRGLPIPCKKSVSFLA